VEHKAAEQKIPRGTRNVIKLVAQRDRKMKRNTRVSKTSKCFGYSFLNYGMTNKRIGKSAYKGYSK